MKKQLRGGRINRINPLIQQIISNEFLRNSESIKPILASNDNTTGN